jgi:hypothetical protein
LFFPRELRKVASLFTLTESVVRWGAFEAAVVGILFTCDLPVDLKGHDVLSR